MMRRVLLLVLALGGCGESEGAPRSFQPPRVDIGGVDAIEAALARERGQAVLLNFWATWCAPCVAELPDLMDVVDEHHARGARVIGVSYDLMLPDMERAEAESLVRGFLAKRELALPTVILDAPDYAEIDARFELPGSIPVTLAYDRDGKLVDRHEGEADRERFEELLKKALGP